MGYLGWGCAMRFARGRNHLILKRRLLRSVSRYCRSSCIDTAAHVPFRTFHRYRIISIEL